MVVRLKPFGIIVFIETIHNLRSDLVNLFFCEFFWFTAFAFVFKVFLNVFKVNLIPVIFFFGDIHYLTAAFITASISVRAKIPSFLHDFVTITAHSAAIKVKPTDKDFLADFPVSFLKCFLDTWEHVLQRLFAHKDSHFFLYLLVGFF